MFLNQKLATNYTLKAGSKNINPTNMKSTQSYLGLHWDKNVLSLQHTRSSTDSADYDATHAIFYISSTINDFWSSLKDRYSDLQIKSCEILWHSES